MINDLPKPGQSSDVLQAAEQKLESQLTPAVRADYQKIVVAGMKVAMQNGPNSIAASIKQSKNPIQDIVKGAINIVGMLGMQSRGTMPIKAAVPACMTLIIQGLDLAKKAGMIQGSAEDLSQATKLFAADVTGKFGITRNMLATASQNIEKLARDPVNMEKMQRAGGFVKDPRVSTPTELPQDVDEEEVQPQEAEA